VQTTLVVAPCQAACEVGGGCGALWRNAAGHLRTRVDDLHQYMLQLLQCSCRCMGWVQIASCCEVCGWCMMDVWTCMKCGVDDDQGNASCAW
jgi:hypothetical protein